MQDITDLNEYRKILFDAGNATDTFAILQIIRVLEAMVDEIEELREKK